MYAFFRLPFLIFATAVTFVPSLIIVSAPAAAADRRDCASAQNIGHVDRRLAGAISQLQHDDRDYGGHRERAVDDLQRARGELAAVRQYFDARDGDDARCFDATGRTGGDGNPYLRGQRGSDANLWSVRRWVESLIDQLQRDGHSYGGHRVAAISDMQQARNELLRAEEDAHRHGY